MLSPQPVYHEKEKEYPPEPYTYEYAVADDYSKANFRAGETSDGNVVTGSYRDTIRTIRFESELCRFLLRCSPRRENSACDVHC